MTRKSAASAKVVSKKKVEPKKPEAELWKEMESVFADAKWTFIETVKVQVKAAKRVDNYLNIRELMQKMGYEKPTVEEIKKMLNVSIETYEQVQKIAEGMTYEQMIKETVPDIFEDIMPTVDSIETQWDEIAAAIQFMSITPYGNNLIQMHNLIMQEIERRGLKPKED